MNAAECVLGLFAKAPNAGQMKTRLAQDSSPAFAAQLAEAMLRDTVDRCRSLPVRRVLVFTPASSRDWFESVADGDYGLIPQGDGDLGARMNAFFMAQFQRGGRYVVALGCDSPDVPIAWVERAFETLQFLDVVIGPACDGGYYLIGASRILPEIFHLENWGGDTVLQQTEQRILEANLSMERLPRWHDVDTLADCRLLKERLAEARRQGNDPLAPNTEETLIRADLH